MNMVYILGGMLSKVFGVPSLLLQLKPFVGLEQGGPGIQNFLSSLWG